MFLADTGGEHVLRITISHREHHANTSLDRDAAAQIPSWSLLWLPQHNFLKLDTGGSVNWSTGVLKIDSLSRVGSRIWHLIWLLIRVRQLKWSWQKYSNCAKIYISLQSFPHLFAFPTKENGKRINQFLWRQLHMEVPLATFFQDFFYFHATHLLDHLKVFLLQAEKLNIIFSWDNKKEFGKLWITSESKR